MIDPHILAGLATLIVLELVLGIDNLVFVAILANKLPPRKRDKARLVGLAMAMGIRLALLAVISHIMALTNPLFEVAGKSFSWRDVILIGGGMFLLFKATSEIHERLEGHTEPSTGDRRVPSFAITILQIVVLDAIFSLDSIITAIGMVDNLAVMMAAVVISMVIMIIASKPLAAFVSRHPTIIILCLSFLLMIGCSLIADGFGFHIEHAYIYAAIAFSLLIETINQIGGHKRRRVLLSMPMRDRTSTAILRLLTPAASDLTDHIAEEMAPPPIEAGGLHLDETRMIRGVISLPSIRVRSIMTLRPEVVWVDVNAPIETVRDMLLDSGRTRVPLCDGAIDEVVGTLETRRVLQHIVQGGGGTLRDLAIPVAFIQRERTVSELIAFFKENDHRFCVVLDESGSVEGVVTTTDVFAVIAGDLADDEDDGLIQEDVDGRLVVDGLARIADIEDALQAVIGSTPREYETVSGHIQHIAERLPEDGDVFDDSGLRVTVQGLDGRQIRKVSIERLSAIG